MRHEETGAEFDTLAAMPQFARFSQALIKLSGVPISLHSPASDRHIAYGREIRNPLCRLIRSSEKGVARCDACDFGHNRQAVSQRKPLLYKCHAGLRDMLVPIFVQGAHVASLSSGQILAESPSAARLAKLKTRLAGLSLNGQSLERAYRAAPYIPLKTVRHIMTLLEIFAVQLCEDLRKISDLQSLLERDDVRRAKTYVADHFTDEELGLAAAAVCAGLSPTHFSRVFKKSTGIPFTHYVQGVRLTAAKKLLLHSEKSISEICYACGFNSMVQFIRVFHIRERTTPGAFRKHHLPASTRDTPFSAV